MSLDPELKAAVDALGEVKHIVSPNFEHVSFAKQVGVHPSRSRPCWCMRTSWQVPRGSMAKPPTAVVPIFACTSGMAV